MTRSKIRTSGAEGLTLSSTALTIANGLTLSDGDIAFADGHGLNFAATGDGSGTDSSELMDDYEEGTWTPTYSSTSASFSYGSQYGTYAKVGGLVYVQLYLLAAASGTTSNAVSVAGLPYSVANINALAQPAVAVWFSGSVDPNPLFNNSQATIAIWKRGEVATAVASDISNKYFVGSGVYRAS